MEGANAWGVEDQGAIVGVRHAEGAHGRRTPKRGGLEEEGERGRNTEEQEPVHGVWGPEVQSDLYMVRAWQDSGWR